MNQVRPVRKRPHERNREPITGRLANPGLVLYVMRKIRQRIPLGVTTLVGDLSSRPDKRHRLEGLEADLPGIVQRKLHHAPDLFIGDAVQDWDDRDDVYPRSVQVFDRQELDVEQISPNRCELAALPIPSNAVNKTTSHAEGVQASCRCCRNPGARVSNRGASGSIRASSKAAALRCR